MGIGYVVTGAGGAVSWGDVLGKPETFPPATHSHDAVDVEWTDIDGKPATFPPDSHAHDYAASGHTHSVAYADVTGKPTTFTPATHQHDWADVTGKPTTFTPAAHQHAIADVTDLATQLAEPARVYVHNGTSYVLSTTTDIFIGPSDPGSGLWIDTDA